MRSAITTISSTLFGASVLIFILALLIPLLRESSSRAGKGETEVHESSGSFKKTIAGLEQKQIPSANNDLQPAITPLQGQVVENQSKGLNTSTQPVDASDLSSPIAPNETAIDRSRDKLSALQTSPETIVPQINEKSTEPVNPISVEEKRSPQYEPMSLLVLGEGLFPPREVTPRANVQETIDTIIPIIKARSPDKVLVEGHADNMISNGVNSDQASKVNKIVSLQRAIAIAKVLEQKGVASDRIIVNGFGDTVPLASNQTKEGREKNRRVEIKLLPAQ
jgi:outer membrane protein OmpA-like peptidoglycan-associated protein